MNEKIPKYMCAFINHVMLSELPVISVQFEIWFS